MRATEAGRLVVHRGDEIAGTLERTGKGCRFTYDPRFRAASPPGVAFQMPPRPEPYTVDGVNLPPFFANLLPEGLRLRAIAGRAGTSVDDLFSLLVEVGDDCVGDVYCDLGEPPDKVAAEFADPALLDFTELERSLLGQARDASIPGEQPKLSAATLALPLTRRRAILKLAPPAYPNLVENEAACLARAKRAGIEVNRAQVVRDRAGRAGLLVERFDRRAQRTGLADRYHVEDACQLLDRYPADKYRLRLRSIMQAVTRVCSAPPTEALRLLRLTAFSYLCGNADLHAKNVSVWTNPGTGLVQLSPAYDLVCTLVYPGLSARMPLPMDAKDDAFVAADFLGFGTRFGLNERAILRTLAQCQKALTGWEDEVATFAPEKTDARRAATLIQDRRKRMARSLPRSA